jgi:hypothetical protein
MPYDSADRLEFEGVSMNVEHRLTDLGLYLPRPVTPPPGVVVTFAWTRRYGDRVYVAGHGPQAQDGSIAGPFGRVGAEVDADQARHSARLATLSMLGSLSRELGNLDRIDAWLKVDGFVLVAPGFDRTTNVINGCSDLLLELFGDPCGRHARTAMGVAATPLSCPVILAAEVAIRS